MVMSTTVSADTLKIDYDSTTEGSVASGYQYVPVELAKAETYTVTLPKSIVLDGSNESVTMDYTVNTVGAIGTTHYVRVIPMSGAKLYNEDGTVALDLDVTLDKKRWTDSEVVNDSGANETTGTMTVDNITPGTWVGQIRFYVTLDDGGCWTAATCTEPAKCIGYDTNDNGVIDEDEKLETPITKGKVLGHKFATGSTAFPDTCERCKKTVFAISTPEQLTAFRDAVNTGNKFAGATITLNADIDMSETPWETGIGKYYNSFAGIFDGNGYTISNLKITRTVSSANGDVCCGFFNYLNDTTLCNVTFKDCSVDFTSTSAAESHVAVVVGQTWSDANIVNVHVYNSNINIDVAKSVDSGIIVGVVNNAGTVIKNCGAINDSIYATSADTDSGGIYIAGFVGCSRQTTKVSNSICNVTCTVGGTRYYSTGNIYNTYGSVGTAINCVEITTGTIPSSNQIYGSYTEATYTNCLRAIADECKTQAAIDILNTDNDYVWVLDLENSNDGYPLIK